MSIFEHNGLGSETETPFASSLSDRTREPGQTIIGEEVRLVGKLYSSAEVLITGQIEGDIECPKLLVGPGGRIDGNVKAKSVIVGGEITGDINVGDVLLQNQSRVSGDISYRTITIEHGANFEGVVHHIDQIEDSSKPAQPFSEESAGQSDVKARSAANVNIDEQTH